MLQRIIVNPLAFCSPLSLLPICPSLLTWNPPGCDRIRPPRSQVARKLTFPFPPFVQIPLIPKSRPPWGSPDLNIHSLGLHREAGSQDPAQLLSSQAFQF